MALVRELRLSGGSRLQCGGGAVAIIQRFGAGLNLNVHVHALVLDGVYVEGDGRTAGFHEAVPPTDEDMDRLLATIDRRLLVSGPASSASAATRDVRRWRTIACTSLRTARCCIPERAARTRSGC
jgi:hypothetical protein